MFLLITIVVILVILILHHLLGRYNENYWKKRGVAFYTKNKVLGAMWDSISTDQPPFLCYNNLYKTYRNEPAVGVGSLMYPSIYVIDLENVQHVLQTDFHSFNHRGIEFAPEDKLADHIVFQRGIRWKLMRQSMTGLFTTSKLKNMYYIIDKSAQDFAQYLIENPSKRTNVFDTLSNFCAAAVNGAIFGITTESIFDSPFAKIARETMSVTLRMKFYLLLANIRYDILRRFRVQVFSHIEDFFIGAIKKVLRQREKDGVGSRHDFADLAVPLLKQGKLVDPDTGYKLEITDELLAAQAFFYYVAGIDTTAAAMYGVLIELGRRPEILKKVSQEIDETWEKCNGKLSFDDLKDMEYLDKVLSESLRMHTPVGFLTRLATRDSVLPVGNIKIEAGTKIYTPIYEIHHDPKYFPNPEEFDPERFSPENKQKYDKAYMPFGKGGRQCIGMIYARLQAKAGLVHMLRHFDVKTTILPGGIKYSKQVTLVRLMNVQVDLICKKEKSS